MHLQVYSLKKTLFDGDVESINCKTTSGEITILNNHHPLITVLQGGTVKIVNSEGKEYYFPVRSGFAEILPKNGARLIVEE